MFSCFRRRRRRQGERDEIGTPCLRSSCSSSSCPRLVRSPRTPEEDFHILASQKRKGKKRMRDRKKEPQPHHHSLVLVGGPECRCRATGPLARRRGRRGQGLGRAGQLGESEVGHLISRWGVEEEKRRRYWFCARCFASPQRSEEEQERKKRERTNERNEESEREFFFLRPQNYSSSFSFSEREQKLNWLSLLSAPIFHFATAFSPRHSLNKQHIFVEPREPAPERNKKISR